MNAEREQGQSGHSDGGNEPSSQAAQPSVTVENASGESIPVRRDTDVTQVAGARLSPEDAADASSSAETPREHGAPAPTVSPETRASSASESDADAAARDNEVTGPRPTPSDDDFVRAEGDDDDDEDELFEGEDRPEGEEDATPEDAHAEEGAEEGSAGEDEDEDPDSDPDPDSDSDNEYVEDEEDIDDPEGDLSENAGGEPLDSDEDSDETVVGGRALGLPPRDESRSEAPLRSRRHHVAPALITLDRVDEDSTFKLRPEEDVSPLATDLARLGQLFPVDLRLKPPDRFQVVCGFRRVAALRFLQRDKVLARLHTDLTDEDALLMSLADAIHAVPIQREELETLRGRLEEEGRLGSEARDMLDKALTEGDALAPETVDEEVDADELAAKVALQLGDINQDLALLADVFASLDANMKQTLLQQLRYSAQLVEFLEGKG